MERKMRKKKGTLGGTRLSSQLTTWELEAGGLQVQDQPGQLNKSLIQNLKASINKFLSNF